MTIQGDKVYFELNLRKEETNKGMIDANGTEGKVYLQKFVCINTIPFSKID
jgi:hypothetical protein